MKYIKKFNEEFFHFGDEPTQPKLDKDNSFDKIVELLERDCKTFLDNNKQVIFRGPQDLGLIPNFFSNISSNTFIT